MMTMMIDLGCQAVCLRHGTICHLNPQLLASLLYENGQNFSYSGTPSINISTVLRRARHGPRHLGNPGSAAAHYDAHVLVLVKFIALFELSKGDQAEVAWAAVSILIPTLPNDSLLHYVPY